MKTYKFFLLFSACLLTLSSCKDYFEPEYSGYVTEQTYYENLNNLRTGMNAVYNVLQKKDYQISELLFGEAVSDNVWTSQEVKSGSVADVVNFTFDTENSYILTRYDINYEGINKANQVIRSAPRVKYKAIPSSYKEIREVTGQAKLLRALFYFNLVRSFGGVSIQSETPQLSNVVVPRSSEQETYAYIEKDLREAVLMLSPQPYKTDKCGQLDASAALGLLIKVLLYEASPGIRTDASVKQQKLQEAYEIGQYFIEGKPLTLRDMLKWERYTESWADVQKRLVIDEIYTLDSELPSVVGQHYMEESFEKVWRIANEFSMESLIEINHYDFGGVGSSADEGWKLYDNMLFGGSPIFATCTEMVVNLFNKDPRQLFSITHTKQKNAYIALEQVPVFSKGIGNDYLYSKYYVFPSEGSAQGRNYRVMRYPEVLLIYSEVLCRLGYYEEALTQLNRVRKRACDLLDGEWADMVTSETGATKSNFKLFSIAPADIMMNNILREKRIEMCGEYDRWYEVCRLDQCSENMATQRTYSSKTLDSPDQRIRGQYFKKGINERFPIPQKEVLISNGVITQNPGY